MGEKKVFFPRKLATSELPNSPNSQFQSKNERRQKHFFFSSSHTRQAPAVNYLSETRVKSPSIRFPLSPRPDLLHNQSNSLSSLGFQKDDEFVVGSAPKRPIFLAQIQHFVFFTTLTFCVTSV